MSLKDYILKLIVPPIQEWIIDNFQMKEGIADTDSLTSHVEAWIKNQEEENECINTQITK